MTVHKARGQPSGPTIRDRFQRRAEANLRYLFLGLRDKNRRHTVLPEENMLGICRSQRQLRQQVANSKGAPSFSASVHIAWAVTIGRLAIGTFNKYALCPCSLEFPSRGSASYFLLLFFQPRFEVWAFAGDAEVIAKTEVFRRPIIITKLYAIRVYFADEKSV